MTKQIDVETTAEAYLRLLAARGIEYFFANAGTDFAPLLDAYAKCDAQGREVPRPVTVPHEITAVAMAHGYTMVTGRPQAVMVHVIVGTANALGGLINAARSNVPMLFTAGRNPITETGFSASRTRQNQWAQESFDQGAMVREFVKWDYELRHFAQLETVVDRALALTLAEPQAPVYLTLPREVLAEAHASFAYTDPSRAGRPGAVVPEPASIARAADLLAAATTPIVIVKAAGRDPGAVPALVALAEAVGAPVFEHVRTYFNFPQDHPLHAGFEAAPYLDEADLVVVVESDAPWFPSAKAPRPEAKVIQVGIDPLFSRYPIRGFPADVALAGTPRLTLAALAQALAGRIDTRGLESRGARWHAEHRKLRTDWAARARAVNADRPIDFAWLSHCVGELVDDRTIVVNEYDLDSTQTCYRRPGSYFSSPPGGTLGWGLGAALGVKLAAPDRTVICCVGDGSYIFGVPTAAHLVAQANRLPLLVVIFNNQGWNAVIREARTLAPDGWTARTGWRRLSALEPAPDYERIVEAFGGHGERVDDPAALPATLARARRIVDEEKRQVVLNVICKKA